MANFPTTLPSFTTKTSGQTISEAHVNSIQDEVVALGVKAGVDGSAVTTTHDYKLGGVTGTDLAASLAGSESLSNKTLDNPDLDNIAAASALHGKILVNDSGDLEYRTPAQLLVDIAAGIIAFPGTEAFSDTITSISTYQTLDLSAITGAATALVVLKCTTTGLLYVSARANGDTEVDPPGYAGFDGQSLNTCRIGSGGGSYLITLTDSSGIIQIKASNDSPTLTIDVMAYIKIAA